ncbi:MAG: UvrB/UvrC motif-containing protein [Phycisphaerae bacterium]|nr:UvrB/UvrC motif-containing protein [Phycisphaerae bacterium]
MGLCERCGKAQAVCLIVDIDMGEKREQHLCDACAVSEGHYPATKPDATAQEYIEKLLTAGGKATSNLYCEHCGIRYSEFRSQGLLGCSHDYDAFGAEMDKLLRRAHDGADHHVGKTPRAGGAGDAAAGAKNVRKLRKLLQEAVEAEDYERAAQLRDRISEMSAE